MDSISTENKSVNCRQSGTKKTICRPTIYLTYFSPLCSVADPGSGAFLTLGSGMEKIWSGSGMNILDHFSESLETVFCVKNTLWCGSGICLTLDRDPVWKNSDTGSGINIPDPQHCLICLHKPAVKIRSYPDPAYAIHDRTDTRVDKFACLVQVPIIILTAEVFDHDMWGTLSHQKSTVGTQIHESVSVIQCKHKRK